MSSEDILTLAPPAGAARIAYGNGAQQFGDLRLPGGAGPHPVVVTIHGGYWRARFDLEYFGHACADLTAHGLATWNIEYRRIGNPGGAWPGTFLDVAAAMDHLRTLAVTHPLDLARVVTLGHSAGGQLALWLAGRPCIAPESPVYAAHPLRPRATIALAGVLDLRQTYALNLSNGAAAELLGGSPDTFPQRYAAASPAELLPLGVPATLFHGSADTHVPFALSADYAERARAAGDDVRLVTLPGVGHFEPVDPRAAEWAAVRDATLDVAMQAHPRV
ncbi:MAG: alpha/beta hydrolase family protein [Ktedonobacterales bacterium]